MSSESCKWVIIQIENFFHRFIGFTFLEEIICGILIATYLIGLGQNILGRSKVVARD